MLLGGLENSRANGRSIDADVTGSAVIKLFESKLVAPEVDWGWVTASVSARGPSVGTATRDGRRVPVIGPASEPPIPRAPPVMVVRYRDASGSGTFWIDEGLLVKFELRLEAAAHDGTAEGSPHLSSWRQPFMDVGTTIMDVPEGARERLKR